MAKVEGYFCFIFFLKKGAEGLSLESWALSRSKRKSGSRNLFLKVRQNKFLRLSVDTISLIYLATSQLWYINRSINSDAGKRSRCLSFWPNPEMRCGSRQQESGLRSRDVTSFCAHSGIPSDCKKTNKQTTSQFLVPHLTQRSCHCSSRTGSLTDKCSVAVWLNP